MPLLPRFTLNDCVSKILSFNVDGQIFLPSCVLTTYCLIWCYKRISSLQRELNALKEQLAKTSKILGIPLKVFIDINFLISII